MCLSDYHGDWSQILTNCVQLKKLIHLTIGYNSRCSENFFDKVFYSDGLQNLALFIQNGLKSLHVKFGCVKESHVFHKNVKNRDDRLLCRICNIIKSINIKKQNIKDRKLATGFILKAEFELPTRTNYTAKYKKLLDGKYLIRDLYDIYSSLCDHFNNVMFAFKVKAFANEKWLLDKIKRHDYSELKSDDAKIVNASWYQLTKQSTVFGVVFRNKGMLDCCYMEPKYEFECYHCRAKPWMDGN